MVAQAVGGVFPEPAMSEAAADIGAAIAIRERIALRDGYPGRVTPEAYEPDAAKE